VAGGESLAEVATLRPLKDNTLIENGTGAVSNGSGPHLFAGRTSAATNSIRRAVMAFDVASVVPPGSEITGATLSLHMSQTSAGPAEVRLHRLLADWGEGASSASGGGGAPAATEDATWIHTFFPDRLWGSPGGDLDPVSRAAVAVDQAGEYTWGPTPEMAADARAWLDDPSGNHGWILIGDEASPTTVKRFDSRENSDEASQPILTIEFVPPCEPRFAGPGYWRRQCLGLDPPSQGRGPGGRAEGLPAPTEPGFEERVLPCADRMLDSLGLPSAGACEAVVAEAPVNCRQTALRKLATLVFNVCAGRLQISCAVRAEHPDCASSDVGELIEAMASLLRGGRCRQAIRCSGVRD
jgi:hypothetical protein